jgi:hypothetical protein
MPAPVHPSKREGKKFLQQSGETLTIVKYYGCNDVVVRFDDGTEKSTFYTQITKGNVLNPNSPTPNRGSNERTIYGVGYIGFGTHKSGHSQAYSAWYHMMKRCYSGVQQEIRPTYVGCGVDEKWHNFQTFAEWHGANYTDGWELDKDILFKGNRVYGPETCCFVPQEINCLFTKTDALRGDYPIGVSLNRQTGKFAATVAIGLGINKHLGLFLTIEDAFAEYKRAKEERIFLVAQKYKYEDRPIPDNVYNALVNYRVEITD